MDNYRFYTSSLLIIYDGNPTSHRNIDIRIIDFAHSVTPNEISMHQQYVERQQSLGNLDTMQEIKDQQQQQQQHDSGTAAIPFTYPPRHCGPDYGYLLGLKSLVMYFESIYTSHGGDPSLLSLEHSHVFDDLIDHSS